MDLSSVQLLIEYHYWARDRLLDAMMPLTPAEYQAERISSFRSIRDTAVHVYSADWVWHSRWRGTSPTAHLSPDRFPDVPALRAAWRHLEIEVRGLFEELGARGIDRVFEYRTLTGSPDRSVFWHMVQHVVNHATYHRGQITTMLRQSGAPPPCTDLMMFYRERSAGQPAAPPRQISGVG